MTKPPNRPLWAIIELVLLLASALIIFAFAVLAVALAKAIGG